MANNPFQSLWKSLPRPLRNRYFLTLVFFMAFMIFVDRHDLLTQLKLQQTVRELERDQRYYEEKIEVANEERLDMEVNRERFARERYFMQRGDEDVFIIVDEDPQ